MMNLLIRFLGIKRNFSNKRKFESIMISKRKEKKYKLPDVIVKSCLNKMEINKYDVYHFYKKESDTIIIYLHGGAYVNDPMMFHLKFIDKIVSNINTDVYLPIYPLAPNHTYKETYSLLLNLYRNILYKNKKIVLMGDSAGGGLALGFTLYLRELKIELPNKLVLISPWVDITMSNEEIKKYEKIDPILSSYGLTEIGKIWAGNSDLKDYKISPIYSDMKGLPNTMIITGKRDILYPDIMLLEKKLKDSKVNTTLIMEKKLYHIYPLYNIIKGNKALLKIIDYIKK